MEIDATLHTSVLNQLLAAWRNEQALGRVIRFVIEAEGLADDSAMAQTIEKALSIAVAIGPLFPGDPELKRFRKLVIPGVSRPDRADLFEVAAEIRNLLRAETVEPDLGTDYFAGDYVPLGPAGPESADQAFWCWADPEKNKPTNIDWAIEKANVRSAWEYAAAKAAQGKGVLVFQPDTGVVPRHIALPENIDADPRSANFVEITGRPIDPMAQGSNPGHGTGTASVVISAGVAMTGSAPLATLVPIRCVESVSVFDQSPVAQAINHAVDKGAHVITMSLGGVLSRALHAAVQKAVRNNVIVLAAAGNCVGEVVWPARYPEVIALGGVHEAFKPWRGSCSGAAVAFSAPAEFVRRADAHHLSGPLAVSGGQGTSFATALTAGIAALWLAYHGRDALIAKLPPGRSLQWLFRTTVAKSAQVPEGFDRENFGAGIIDALGLLKRDPATDAASGGEEAAEGPMSDDLRGLLAKAFGEAGAEAASPVLVDRLHAPELACMALDRLRARRTLRAHVESRPPPMLSPSLRAALGERIRAFR
jgi:serine protease